MTDHGETTLLRARGLATTIAEGRRVELSFSLGPGQVLQLGGPSGCGKTTALRMLSRLTAAQHGEMLLDGVASTRIPAPTWRRRLAYLAQQPVMLEGSVRQNLLAGFDTTNAPGPAPDDERPRRLLQDLGLDPDELLEQDARVLSGGEAARVALARTLLLDPAVLLADEPTAALDPDNAAALVRVVSGWLADDGGALVLVAHDAGPWDGVARRVLDMGTGEEVAS